MKVFQIFSHPFPPCEPYFGYMQKARDMAESYTLIAPQNFMGAGFVSIHAVLATLPTHLRENTNGAFMLFDALRVRYLTEHFDHVYADVDVELLKPIEIQALPQKSGPGVLVGNGNPETAAACWAMYNQVCNRYCGPASLMFSGGIPHVEVDPETHRHYYAKGLYF